MGRKRLGRRTHANDRVLCCHWFGRIEQLLRLGAPIGCHARTLQLGASSQNPDGEVFLTELKQHRLA